MDNTGGLARVKKEERREARPSPPGRSEWLVWGTALAIWLSKVAFVLTRPIQSLAKTPYLIDDSFIGMQIAYNLGRGRGYTFDGVSATTGAPPLWTWLTVPLHLLFDKEHAAQATILLSAALAGLCTVLVFQICRRMFGLSSAYAAFSLATLSFPLLFQSLNGMETFLFAAIGLLVMKFVLERQPSYTRAVSIGLLLGILVWTRADGVVLGLLLLGWEAALAVEGRRKERLKHTLVMAIPLFSLTALFLVWNVVLSGWYLPANQSGRYWIAHGYWTTWDWSTYMRMGIGNVWMFLQLYRITLGSITLVSVAGIGVLKRMGRRWQSRVLPFVM